MKTKLLQSALGQRKKGFSLVELMAVMTIIAILAGVISAPLLGVLERARLDAEEKRLNQIAEQIKSTFQSEDLEEVNVSALKEDIPSTVNPTVFDFYGTVAGNSNGAIPNGDLGSRNWYSKVGRQIGTAMTLDGVKSIFENANNGRRYLIAGPKENNVQRYLLLSFMLPDDISLAMPKAPAVTEEADYAAWFDEIFLNEWGMDHSTAPVSWGAAWNNSRRGITNAGRVKAVRIIQQRYRISLNVNLTNHKMRRDIVYIAYNGRTKSDLDVDKHLPIPETIRNDAFDGTQPEVAWTSGNPDVNWEYRVTDQVQYTGTYPDTSLPGILAGRRVQISHEIRRADSADNAPAVNPVNAIERLNFWINQNTTISIQND